MTVEVTIWTFGEAIGPMHIDSKICLLLRLALSGVSNVGYRNRHILDAIPWLTAALPAVA